MQATGMLWICVLFNGLADSFQGYNSIEEYYTESSGKNYLANIKIPFLVLQALDDPIIPSNAIPYRAFLENPNLILATTHTGGHIAWFEGWDVATYNWADSACIEFMQSVMNHVPSADIATVI